MPRRTSHRDKSEYRSYLEICTDKQVQGCYEKEKAAKRRAYVNMCKDEAKKRNMILED